MKIRCAIFDFDGTLFDSMYIWDTVGETFLRSVGKEPKPSLREAVRALSLYQSACYLREEYALPLSAEEIMAGIHDTITHFYLHEVLPKPGAAAFLKQLKKMGIFTCIATASARDHVEAALARCGMERCVDAIFTCGEVGHGKDEPVIFQKAAEYFCADRSTAVVFEDARHAIRTAKADGFRVVGVFDDSEKRQEEIKALSDCYLLDFEHTQVFWNLVSCGTLGAPPYAAK